MNGIPTSFGTMDEFTRDPIACMRRLRDEFGDLVALQEDRSQRPLIFAFGSQHNRTLLSQSDAFHSQFFAIRGPRLSAQRRLTSGLLSMNGAEHSQQRRLIMTAFQRRVIPGYLEIVRQYTAEMLLGWKVGTEIDLAVEVTRLMLRITSTILLGVGRQRPGDQQLTLKIGERMEAWVQLNHDLGMAAFVSGEGYQQGYQELLQFAESVELDVRKLIAGRLQELTQDGHAHPIQAAPNEDCLPEAAAPTDVLSMLLLASQRGAGITEEQLIGQTALLFAAAHMTTAHTLGWTLFLLAQHPDVLGELDAEIRCSAHRPGVESSRLPTGRPVAEAQPTRGVGPLPAQWGTTRETGCLLDRVIRESMRVLPASSYSQRVCVADSVLANHVVPAGSIVVFSQFMTHHDSTLYDSPEQFLPSRWQTTRRGPYEFLPFGGGARLCVGAPLAMAILQTIIPMILERFHLAVQPNSTVNALVVSTMLNPIDGLPMEILDRNDFRTDRCVDGNINQLVDLPPSHTNSSRRAA